MIIHALCSLSIFFAFEMLDVRCKIIYRASSSSSSLLFFKVGMPLITDEKLSRTSENELHMNTMFDNCFRMSH